ncbi:MAG: DUF6448 family protein [Candidatus Abyssubacteria bacterium]
MRKNALKMAGIWVVFVLLVFGFPAVAAAHCDTLDGPVIADARKALADGDATPALKWVKPEHEAEVRAAFEKVLAVRTKGPEAKELADMYFFETLVRLHRAGEGAPYTGLKPAGSDLPVVVVRADTSFETGEVDNLVTLITDDVAAGIRKRFHHAYKAKQHADDSVEAGRGFVAAYVEFVHYVERLHQDALTSVTHGAEPAGEAEHSVHGH